jgi:hypothetical protein
MGQSEFNPGARDRRPWNADRKIGGKRALKPQQVWAIRFWLDHERRLRDRAMFDLAIDSKLRGCDKVKVRISDLVAGGQPNPLVECSIPLRGNLGSRLGVDFRSRYTRQAGEKPHRPKSNAAVP